MLGEPENQFSLTRGAISTVGPAKSNFLSVQFSKCLGQAVELMNVRAPIFVKQLDLPSEREIALERSENRRPGLRTDFNPITESAS
jgi:hypothetical protein